MTLASLKRKKHKAEPICIGPDSNGMLMTAREFDRAEAEEGWQYELINGVLIVSPSASIDELDPNDQLGYWLRLYRNTHPQGASLDSTVPEWLVRTGSDRRRADRCLWAGLGRLPRKHEHPTIVIEFVSSRKRDRLRDYETKRDEYLAIKVKEYWVIDRFDRCMVVFTRQKGKTRRHVVAENQIYTTPLLPGFELDLAQLLAIADRWKDDESEAE